MMRLETERKLAEHFMNIANHEKYIERQRMVLNEYYRFQPNSAFKRVDRLNNKKINSYDIANFLRDSGYNYYSVDLGDLINAYDGDKDGHIDFKEFQKIFVTHTDSVLRQRANERYEEYVGFRDKLAPQVEKDMCSILVNEVEGLRILNKEKESLKNRYDFSRLDAFRAIDNYRISSLMREDIRSFLNKNGVEATALDADNLFRRLDLDLDGRITYSEFCDYIETVGTNINSVDNNNTASYSNLQKGNITSRNQSEQRINFGEQTYNTPQRGVEKLPYEKNDRYAKTDLKNNQYNLQNKEVNEEVERNYIVYGIREKNSTPLKRAQSASPDSTKKFNQNNSRFYNSEDKLASLQTTPSPTKQKSTNQTPASSEKEKKQSKAFNNNGEARLLDLDDIQEEDRENQDSFASDQMVYKFENNEASYEEAKVSERSNIKEQNYQQSSLPSLEQDDEENLAETLKNMIYLESDIEKSKQILSLKADFNLLDAFRLFDKNGLGELTKHDLEEGLKKIGLYSVNKKDLELFFKRYDTNSDYKLRYLEFTDALTPKDRIYADHLTNKRPNYDASNPEESITMKTKLEFGDTMRMLLKCEGYSEEMRQNLSKKPLFSISAAFQTVDINNNGYIAKNELKSFLENHEFFATQKEIELLFSKMDADKDGKISYGEFFSEIANKIPY